MRKMFWMLLATVVTMALALPAMAEDEMVTVRRSWALSNGTYIRHIPFPFQVPWSNGCGTLEVKEYKKSQSFFGVVGSWETKNGGESVSAGWYRFEVKDADLAACTPLVDFNSNPVSKVYMDMPSGAFMEVEPEDLGLFTKNGVIENIFNLSTDDTQFSYELVISAPNTVRTLDSFMKNTHFFSDSGKNIVGAIVADSHGFLKDKISFDQSIQTTSVVKTVSQPVLPRNLPKGFVNNPWVRMIIAALTKPQPPQPPAAQLSPADIMVREGDIVVLIRNEQLPY